MVFWKSDRFLFFLFFWKFFSRGLEMGPWARSRMSVHFVLELANAIKEVQRPCQRSVDHGRTLEAVRACCQLAVDLETWMSRGMSTIS